MASSGAVEKERETSSAGMNDIEHTITAIKNLSLDDDYESSSSGTRTNKGKRKMPDEFNDDEDDDFFKDYYSDEYLLRQAESEKEKEKRLSEEIEESLITKLSRMAIVSSTPQMKKKTRKVAESDDCGKVLAKIEEAIKRRECVRVLIRVVLVVMKTLVQECILPYFWNVINILLCSYVGYASR
ncbi:hypothetical protein ABFX02_14G232700 [Erythranthe guttata]